MEAGHLRLIELGGVLIGLAILARVAGRLRVPAIPLYLLAGLAFGRGGLVPLVTTREFIQIGAEIGLILLLLSLGLEYSARELVDNDAASGAGGVARSVPQLHARVRRGTPPRLGADRCGRARRDHLCVVVRDRGEAAARLQVDAPTRGWRRHLAPHPRGPRDGDLPPGARRTADRRRLQRRGTRSAPLRLSSESP